MSMLERLTIRGIRNFGVDAEDEQKITFTAPLTLILGQNGSGKTTIIECIKYALTGELPPNCKGGIGFINNPDVLHINESLGQAKLRIKNHRGVETTICRSAKVIKKNQKSQFKSLDATITMNENGREVSISKRNNDATEDMCTAMGVTKAIINHVLFCHQEEANWPLGTDAELMAKFDQIFGTTEYNNALDKMRAMRKKYEATIKDQKVTLKEKQMLKDEADRKNMEINKYEDEVRDMQGQFEQYAKDLEPIKEEYKKTAAIGERLSSITASKTKVETELKNEKENEHKLSSKIKDIFAGSDFELEQEINLFKTRQSHKHDEVTKIENDLETAENEYEQIKKRVDENDRKYHTLIQDRCREQDLYDEKADYISKLCTDLNITVGFDIKNDNERASGLVPSIRTALKQEQGRIKEINDHNEKVDAEQEHEIRGYSKEEARIKSEITSIAKQLKDSEHALNEKKNELKKVDECTRRLADSRQKLAQIRQMSEQLIEQSNTQGTQNEIAAHREEKIKIVEELEGVDEQITVINMNADVLAQVTGKEKHIEKRESDVRRIKNKHFNNLRRLFPDETIESNFKRRIETLAQKLLTEVNKLEAEVRLKENQAQKYRLDLESKKKYQLDYEAELRKLKSEIDQVCEQTPFIDILAETKEKVAKLQMEHSSYKSSEVFYKNYIRQMKDQPCCPLCHKDLNGNEVGDLTIELTDEIEKLPDNINRSEQALKEASKKLEKLLGLQSHVERVDKLKSNLIPQVNADIEKIERDLRAAQEKSKQSSEAVEEPRDKKALVTTMLGDMSILDEAIRDIEQNRIELEPLKQALAANQGQSDVSMDTLQKKRKELSDRNKYLEREIERKEKSWRDKDTSIRKCKEREIEVEKLVMTLQGDIQKSEALKAREHELIELIKQLKEKKVANDQLLIPIEGKIRHAEEKRRRTKADGVEKLANASRRFDGLKKTFDSMERVSKDLEKLADLKLDKEIERYDEILKNLRGDQSRQAEKIDLIREKIKSLTKEIAEQQNIERDLQDNFELKKIQKKVAEKQRELETLLRDEREVDFQQIIEKKAKLARDMETIMFKRTRMDGQMNEKRAIINSLRTENNKPEYRDSVRNYKKAYYENFVYTKTVEDITTYCETLEKALTKFHSDKMEKINSMIRDLWRSIYKGNDIDYIQINTEEVKGTSKRRSYTYRVVASKNDTFMDFRGQSSAGQRVLACLIIRIALAETFSGHCGVLALDEPTTNLDKINIESLCEALNRIVDEREGQRNFMLLVITHDEDFINSMGRVMSYTRVSRDNNGKSRTQKLRVQ